MPRPLDGPGQREETSPCSADLFTFPYPKRPDKSQNRTVAWYRLRPPLPPSAANGDQRPEVSLPSSLGSSMASLAPHFKWAPSPSSVTHSHHHPSASSTSSNSGRSSGRSPFGVQCAVTSAAATVFHADRVTCGPLRLVYSSPDTAPVLQDLLKLEAIQAELAEYNGAQPTFPKWAAAAGTDESTLRKRLDHGIRCKNRMVTSNVRLVISIAREFEGPGLELYDLIQEGMQGLIRGAEKFDASKGFRFSTYSHWWIKQAMRKSVSEQTQIFRLPAHMVEASYRVKECTKRLRRKLKRRPSNKEIAVDIGMPVKRVEAAVNLPKYSVSLDSKIGSTDMTYQEVTADPSAETAEEMLNRISMKKDVHQALDTLSPRERQVVKLRFGIDDLRIRTLQEIGNIMGVSRERIRQIESGAFRKLRGKKKVKSLKDYLVPVGNW
ncbi:hypothetical protein ACQ4PT_057257 [Festuca glaucescens]